MVSYKGYVGKITCKKQKNVVGGRYAGTGSLMVKLCAKTLASIASLKKAVVGVFTPGKLTKSYKPPMHTLTRDPKLPTNTELLIMGLR